MLMPEFKDRLIIALKRKNMKPIELAEKVKCSRSLISQYMSGKCKAKQDLIFLMAKELEVKPSWLMGFEEDEEEKPSQKDLIISFVDNLNESEKEKLYNVMISMFPERIL